MVALVDNLYRLNHERRGLMLGNAFGEWLGGAREAKGLTTQQLADNAELSQPYVSLLEKGQRNPSRKSVRQLARALGVDPEEGLRLAGFYEPRPEGTGETIRIAEDLEIKVIWREGPADKPLEVDPAHRAIIEYILRSERQKPLLDDSGK